MWRHMGRHTGRHTGQLGYLRNRAVDPVSDLVAMRFERHPVCWKLETARCSIYIAVEWIGKMVHLSSSYGFASL